MRAVGWLASVALVTACATAGAVPRPVEIPVRQQPRPIVPPVPTRGSPVHVMLVGDSLAWEASGPFANALTKSGDAVVKVMAYGGTDWCTYAADLRSTVASFHPDAVALEFSGNNLGPCMADPDTGRPLSGEALVLKYVRDATDAIDYLLGQHVAVYLASIPVARRPHPQDGALGAAIVHLAEDHPGVRYVDAGATVEAHGTYADYLPCLPNEPCLDVDPTTGLPAARVRAPDGVHFCPDGLPAVNGVTPQCDRWSSGASRYGKAIADPIITDFGL